MVRLDIKNAFNSLLELCETMDNNAIGCSTFGKTISTANQLQIDFVTFCCLIINADNSINPTELSFLSDYFDFYTCSKDLINLKNIKLPHVTEMPLSFKVFVEADKKLKAVGSNAACSQLYFSLLYAFGMELMATDGETSEQEVSVFSAYLQQLKNYATTNSVSISDETVSVNNLLDDNKIVRMEEDSETLDSLLYQLNCLIGLDSVKNDIHSLINLVKVRRLKKERGFKLPTLSLHMVFTGNPGTGKTTVARLLAAIYCKMGLLSKGHLIETDRSGLIGGYVGQTAIKVKEVVDSALGGILFIDEAYSLVGKGPNDYGLEAIETLLKAMEDHRKDFLVIVAGYPELMKGFISSNPGLRSRFNKYIHFQDYSSKELFEILIKLCSDNEVFLSEEAKQIASQVIDDYWQNKPVDFANGRDVRNYFEKMIVNQANRIASLTSITDEVLRTLTIEDVINASIP